MRTPVGDAVVTILEEHPNYPSRTLAGILCDRHPILFPHLEQARNAIRHYRGAHAGGGNFSAGRYHRPHGTQSDRLCPMPAPLESGKPWRIVPVEFKRALVLFDVHIPYHARKPLEMAVKYGREFRPDCIILGGDVVDFYAVSFWEKNPEERCLRDEIEAGKLFLEYLRDRFPRARIIYKEGNHEERLWRYCAARAEDLFGLLDSDGRRILRLDSLLDFKNYGVELVDNKQPIRCGPHLHILHGHEFRAPFQNPVNPARGLYLRAKCNAICGDLHQSSSHTEAGLTHTVSCWSAGALCDLHPRYMPLNKWNHGFATIELAGDAWSLQNKKIIGEKTVVSA